MKILHCINTMAQSHGGPVVALLGLANSLAQKSNVKITATHSKVNADDIDAFNSQNLSIHVLRNARGRFQTHPDMKPELEKLITQVDVVHIHGIWESIQHHAAQIAKRLRKPFIIRPCGMLDPWSINSRSKLIKRACLKLWIEKNLRQADSIHFTTKREAELAAPFTRPDQVAIEPNGLELQHFRTLPMQGAFRQKFGIGDRKIVLFLSRISPKKGLDLLIPAFGRLKDEDEDAVLVIAGPDENGHQRQVKKWISEHSLSDRVIFTGMLDRKEKTQAYVDCDLFALTSYQENFGNVVIEAMACNTPVLISDQVNLCDDVSAANAGVVVKMNVDEISSTLSTMLSDTQRLKRFGNNGRELVFKQFDWNEIGDRWMGRYRELITSNSR